MDFFTNEKKPTMNKFFGGNGDDVDCLASEESVFSVVTQLCRHLVAREICGGADAGKERAALVRRLRKIAFSRLLRSPGAPVLDESDPESLSLALFETIAAKRIAEDRWDEEDYNRAYDLTQNFEILLVKYNPPWADGIVRFLVDLVRCDPGSVSLPPSDQQNIFTTASSQTFLPIVPHNVEERVSSLSVLWTSFRSQLQLLRLPPRNGTKLVPCLSLDGSAERRLPVSHSNWDEGFFSPTVHFENTPQKPFDWNDVDIGEYDPPLDMDSLGESASFRHHVDESHRRIQINIQQSPSCLVKVSKETLQQGLKGLLLGAPSSIFPLVNGSITMIPGLYTDWMPPNMMTSYVKEWLDLGNVFRQFLNLTEVDPAPACSNLQSSLAELKLEYSQAVLSHCLSLQFSKSLSFLHHWLEYVVGILKTGLTGWRLLEKLCDDIQTSNSSDTFKAALPLFFDCSVQYMSMIDKWIFEGVWPQELFCSIDVGQIHFKNLACVVPSDLRDVPTFMPAKELLVCGMLFQLLESTCRDEKRNYRALMRKPCRPTMSLVLDRGSYENLKIVCDAYSHLGEDLRAKIFAGNDESELAIAATKKAALDILKFQKLQDQDRENKMRKKLARLAEMKEEIRKYEEHKKLSELENILHTLLSDDQIMLDELKRVVANCNERAEIISKFLHQEEIYTRKLVLNNWKRKRYILSAKREAYFANLGLLTQLPVNQEERYKLVEPCSLEDAYCDGTFRPITPPTTVAIQNAEYPLAHTDEHVEPRHSIVSTPSNIRPSPPVVDSAADCESCVTQSSELLDRPDDRVEQTADCRLDPNTQATIPSTSPCKNEISSSIEDSSRESKFYNEKCIELGGIRRSSYSRMAADFTRRAPNSVLKPFEKITDYLQRESALRDTCLHQGDSPNASDNSLWEAPHFFLKESIELPLKAQIKVINNILMYQIIVDHDFLGHIDRIRQTYFLNDGVFALNLAENLLNHFKDGDVCNYRHYNQLQKILRACRPADGEYLTLVVDDDVDLDKNHHALVLPIVQLEYKISAPLDAVFTDEVFMQCNKVFSHLLGIERIRVLHKQALDILKGLPSSTCDHHKISLQRHSLNVFMTHLKFYCGWTVEDCHRRFLKSIKDKNVDSLYREYSRLVIDLHVRLLLTNKHPNLRQCLKNLLRCIMSYFKTLVNGQWCLAPSSTDSYFEKMAKLDRTFDNFKKRASDFQELLRIYVDRQEHDYLQFLLQKLKSN